jgi:predicted GNAT family acetyltransferase
MNEIDDRVMQRQALNVTRYETAEAFLHVAEPLMMMAEAENNLILSIAQGLARNPGTAVRPYLATVGSSAGVHACAVHIAPYKLVITRANRDPVVELVRDAFQAVPDLEGVSGPSRSVDDFVLAWSRLSGVAPTLGKRLRIHETRRIVEPDLPPPSGRLRQATADDRGLLAAWTVEFVRETNVPDPIDADRIVADSIARGRLYVWDDAGPVSMAAWAGKTPNGVRINFVYTPRELRGKGYGTACVKALTALQLDQGNAFCWLYTDVTGATSPRIFKRIGYRPVSDVTEYYLR